MEFKSFMEALKGKQHKIDKNKNGKVDAHDFELLRKEETEELDEIHRMKTKLNKLDDVSNKSVARQKLSNLMKSGKARGALIANKMRTLNMGDDIDQEDLDALQEVMSKDAKAGDWISDFVHSTNPKFDGKSKKERINMALGAYYDTHKKKDGISEQHPVAPVPDRKYIKGTPENKALKDSRKPINGMPTNMNKEEVEEIEEGGQIYGKPPQPVKIDTTLKFKPTGEKTSGDNPLKKPFTVPSQRSNAPAGAKSVKESVLDKIRSRVSGELEQSSAHRQALAAAQNQAAIDRVHNHAATHAASAAHDQHHWQQASKEKENNHAAKLERDKIQQAHYNTQRDKINSAFTKKVTKEEIEQIEERNKQNALMRKTMDASRGARYKLNNPVPDAEPEHKTAQAHNKAIGRALRNEDKMTTTKDKSGKLVSFKYEGDWKKTTKADAKKDPAGKVANMAGQAMQKMRKVSEEKDEQEYGYEGDMALNQLATLTRCAEMIKEILKPDTDMPEWVQSKITLATDYIQTAADYMHSEMNEAKSVEVKVNAAGDAAHEEKWEAVKKLKKIKEDIDQLDELSIDALKSYIKGAKANKKFEADTQATAMRKNDHMMASDSAHKIQQRKQGIKDAKAKLNKESFDDEGNLISNKVSYKEFMLEYTPGPGGVTQIKGRSYGANYSDPEGADDADDNKPMKPAAEKRGRGRPAGAKSGARKITGTSKLMNK
jgi:hypothetical protein